MPTFALASELHRLSPDAIARIDHIIADDGDWTPEQIQFYIRLYTASYAATDPTCDDWTHPTSDNLP